MDKVFDKKIKFFEICFIVYVTWYFLPAARGVFYGGQWNVFFFLPYALSIGHLLMKSFKLDSRSQVFRTFIPVAAYMIVMAVFYYFNYKSARAHIRVSFTFWGTYLFYMLSERYPESQKRIAKYLILLYIVTYATTFFNIMINSSVARMLTDASADKDLSRSTMAKNVGNIYLVQTSVIFIPFIMNMLFFGNKRFMKKLLCVGLLAFELYFLLSASFTLSLLVYVITIAISVLFLSANRNNMSMMFKLIVLVFICIILFSLDWAEIFRKLSDGIENEYIAQRFDGVASLITGGVGAENASSRPELYMMSLQTFFDTIWGVGPNYTYIPGFEGVGQHSQICDDLARYGVFGLMFYFTFFKRFYRMLYDKYKTVGQERVVLPMVLTYMIFLTVNIGFRSQFESIVILFILPTLPDLLSKSGQETMPSEEEALK